MHMGGYDLSYPPCEYVPDYDTAIVAAHGQQRPVLVESTSQGQRDAIQRTIEFLGVVLSKRF